MSKIIKLESENIKRLKAVSITPDPTFNAVGGNNAQGKTSLLDSIEMALGGKKSIPDMPLRSGQKKGRIVLETEDLIVTRNFTEAGSTIKVTNKEGMVHTKAQSVLDDLIGRLTMDPLAFTHLSPKEQGATLRDLLGLDTNELDTKRKEVFDSRTEKNRRAKELKAQLDGLAEHEGVPEEEVSVSDLVAKKDAADDFNNNLEDIGHTIGLHENRLNEIVREIDELKAEHEKVLAQKANLQSKVSGQEIIDTSKIIEQINNAEDTNRKVRENQKRKEIHEAWSSQDSASKQLTATLEKIDAQKAEMLASAEYPIDGIGIDDDGILTYNGIPFTQASAAEQLRVSAAMALALNPKLRVLLIRDGSLLDRNAMEELHNFATENDAQVWIERVGNGDEVTVLIEDGEVSSK